MSGAADKLDDALDDGAGPSIEPPHVDTAGPADPPAPAPTGKADKAPRTRKRTANGSTPRGGRPSKAAATQVELQRQLTESFGMIGIGLMALGTSPAIVADGQAVIVHAEPIAQALAQLAAQNPSVQRVLTATLSGGAWFGVVAAVGGLGMAIAQNHGALPTAGTVGQAPGVDLGAAADLFGSTPADG